MPQVQTVEQKQHFKRGLYNSDSATSKAKEILVLTGSIAGMQHHLNVASDEGKEILASLQPGVELKLYRDSENEHDEWAVGIYTENEVMLGYISRFKNQTIARLMDAGKRFIARVDAPEDAASQTKQLAPTEVGKVYFSAYLVEE